MSLGNDGDHLKTPLKPQYNSIVMVQGVSGIPRHALVSPTAKRLAAIVFLSGGRRYEEYIKL